MKHMTKLVAIALAAQVFDPLSALAGGFQRGQADVDILFEPGNVVARSGFTYVAPTRRFTSLNGVAGNYADVTEDFVVPSHSIKFGQGPVACAGAYTESFGGDADYSGLPGGALPAPARGGLTSRNQAFSFSSDEVSATCRLSYDLDRGRISFLGGVYAEDFTLDVRSLATQDLTGAVLAANPALHGLIGAGAPLAGTRFISPLQVDVDARGSYETGWRVGAAYEIPDIALRAQIVYRSQVEHDSVTGTAVPTSTAASLAQLANGSQINLAQFGALSRQPGLGALLSAALPGAGTVLRIQDSSLNTITSPQSLNISLQSGIAQDTLLFGSFRWTDWSTLDAAIISVGGVPGSVTPFLWRDGYTANVGVGRRINELVSGVVSVGYDRGVGDGADAPATDVYTLGAGLSLRQGIGELRVGGQVGYITSGSQTVAAGANFDATTGNDWAYAGNVSFRLSF